MTSRTRQDVVYFANAFSLAGLDMPLPAGTYRVDYDEESIDGASWIAWHNVGTFLYLPTIAAGSQTKQMMPIDWEDLQSALKKDQQ